MKMRERRAGDGSKRLDARTSHDDANGESPQMTLMAADPPARFSAGTQEIRTTGLFVLDEVVGDLIHNLQVKRGS